MIKVAFMAEAERCLEGIREEDREAVLSILVAYVKECKEKSSR